MHIVKWVNVNTTYTIINQTRTLNLMFSSINIAFEYINTWNKDHDSDDSCKTLNFTSFNTSIPYLLIDFSNCLAGASKTNYKVSIPNFTPLNSTLSFCKLLYFVKSSMTISSTLDGFLLP